MENAPPFRLRPSLCSTEQPEAIGLRLRESRPGTLKPLDRVHSLALLVGRSSFVGSTHACLSNQSDKCSHAAEGEEALPQGPRQYVPLGLLTLAALHSFGWEIARSQRKQKAQDYDAMPRPDLVGITAFSSQAWRAYNLAAGV